MEIKDSEAPTQESEATSRNGLGKPAAVNEDRLEKLGLVTASAKLKNARSFKRKMALAYEHYRFITPEKLQAFREKVWKRPAPSGYRMDVVITPLVQYAEVPPADVLDKLEEAIGRKCFDAFEVLKIDQVKVDPLLLGTIAGCQDKFYIAAWDHDVSIEEILKANEG